MEITPIQLSDVAGAEEWEDEVIPMDEILPKYSDQEHFTTYLLLKEAQIQQFESNIKGDNTSISFNSELFEHFPLQTGETLRDYSTRVLGYQAVELTEQQKSARDKMNSIQMEKEWKTMHAYHFNNFVATSVKPAFVSFPSSSARRKTEEEQEDRGAKRQREIEEESDIDIDE